MKVKEFFREFFYVFLFISFVIGSVVVCLFLFVFWWPLGILFTLISVSAICTIGCIAVK